MKKYSILLVIFIFGMCTAQVKETKDSAGKTNLYIASEVGNDGAVKRLIMGGADINSLNTDMQFSPIHAASGKGNVEIIQILLEKGADVNTKTPTHQFTPLHIASTAGRLNSAKVLLEKGADKNAKDIEHGWTALHHAAAAGHKDIIKLLIDNGADKSIKDNDGKTYLEVAGTASAPDAEESVTVDSGTGIRYILGKRDGCYYMSGSKKVYVDRSMCGGSSTSKTTKPTTTKGGSKKR